MGHGSLATTDANYAHLYPGYYAAQANRFELLLAAESEHHGLHRSFLERCRYCFSSETHGRGIDAPVKSLEVV